MYNFYEVINSTVDDIDAIIISKHKNNFMLIQKFKLDQHIKCLT